MRRLPSRDSISAELTRGSGSLNLLPSKKISAPSLKLRANNGDTVVPLAGVEGVVAVKVEDDTYLLEMGLERPLR